MNKALKDRYGIASIDKIDNNTICIFRYFKQPIIIKVGEGYSRLYRLFKKKEAHVYHIDKKSEIKNVITWLFEHEARLERLGKLNMLSAFGKITEQEERERFLLQNTPI